jgi:hypothetical protein
MAVEPLCLRIDGHHGRDFARHQGLDNLTRENDALEQALALVRSVFRLTNAIS